MNKHHFITATGFILFSLPVGPIWAYENSREISELCRPSNDSGIKIAFDIIFTDRHVKPSEIRCQRLVSNDARERSLDTKYSTDRMIDPIFREIKSSIKNSIQPQFKSLTDDAERMYRQTSKSISTGTFTTAKGYQTLKK